MSMFVFPVFPVFPITSFPSPSLHSSVPPPLSIFSQQQIFIWWFTQGLCSPGCQQPKSFSAKSRWFPGCILPRFPPVEGAKRCSHTLLDGSHPGPTEKKFSAKTQVTFFTKNMFTSWFLSISTLVQLCKSSLVDYTLRTKVLSLSGISSGMVVLTSTMADRGMLTLGFEDFKKNNESAYTLDKIFCWTVSDKNIKLMCQTDKPWKPHKCLYKCISIVYITKEKKTDGGIPGWGYMDWPIKLLLSTAVRNS